MDRFEASSNEAVFSVVRVEISKAMALYWKTFPDEYARHLKMSIDNEDD